MKKGDWLLTVAVSFVFTFGCICYVTAVIWGLSQ